MGPPEFAGPASVVDSARNLPPSISLSPKGNSWSKCVRAYDALTSVRKC